MRGSGREEGEGESEREVPDCARALTPSCSPPLSSYWRYISIYRHLQRNPENQLYPLFEYFENWCQDENRHGDFFAAILKARPELMAGTQGRLWARFFCLSVYVTMYLNDHSRSAFYELLGLDTTQFNRHVIIETNKTTARIFPEVPDTDDPAFWPRMDKLVGLSRELSAVSAEGGALAGLRKVPIFASFAAVLLSLWFGRMQRAGSADLDPSVAPVY